MHRVTPRVRIIAAIAVTLGLLMSLLVLVPVLMVMGTAAVSTSTDSNDTTACGPSAAVGGQTVTLDADQEANARTIVSTGQSLNVPGRGLVVALATSLQESTLQNIQFGTGSSLGLFQQISAWGPPADRTDPVIASKMFFTGGEHGQRGLLQVPGWSEMSINDAAQAVQASAFPQAYAKWEAFATSLATSITGNDPLSCADVYDIDLPTGTVGTMLRAALAQLGKPYVWGATGPDSFDCSGLVKYSWQQAGYSMGIRTAAQMYDDSTPVDPGQEQPGDMLFGEFSGGDAGHVMIVIKQGTAVEAPHTGDVVKVVHYTAGQGWRLGRFKPGVLVPINAGAAAA